MKKRKSLSRKDKSRFSAIVIAVSALLAIQGVLMMTDGDLFKVTQAITDRNVHELLDSHNIDSISDIVTTSAFNMHHDYKENAVSANQKYSHSRIGIIGKVLNVEMNSDDLAIINLKVFLNGNVAISAEGDSNFTSKSASIKTNQQVLMICQGAVIHKNTPKLKDCKLYSNPV